MSDTSVIFSILAVERVTETLSRIPGSAALSGAAIGAALMGGIGKAMDQQSAGNMLMAQIGGTPEMARSFGKIAGDLYSQNFGESIEDIDDAIKGVWQNGLISEDASDAQIQAVTGKVVNASKIMNASYDEVSRTVSQMLRTGVAQSADEAFDVLIRGAQQGIDKSGDLLDTFNEYPVELRKLGLDATQSMGLLSQAIKAGARDSDVAADALKEFAIRAVDGSKTTSTGFKALGLDAGKMAAEIGAGGSRANAALDLTLDRLRAMPDPVARSQAAVALFGTQAEDLGDALYAMDPSAAVQAMGKVAGAADEAGKTLHQGAGAQLETFKRQIVEAFVNVVGGQVIPKIEQFGAITRSIGGWAKDNWGWLGPTLGTLGSFVGVIGGAIAAYRIWTAVTEAVTAAQVALDLAMDANPVGIIIIAVLALVAAIAYLWTHSEGFRNFFIGLWDHVWGFLKSVGSWFAGPFTDFFVSAGRAIAAPFQWLYHQVLEPAWHGIAAAAQFAQRIISSVINLVRAEINMVIAPVVMWLWRNVFEPAWQGIAGGAMWLYHQVLTPIGHGIAAVAQGIGAAAMWLWHNAIDPAVQGVASAFQWVWGNVISPVFGWIEGAVRSVGRVVGSVFGAIGGAIGSAFSGAEHIVKSALNAVISVLNGAIGGINSLISSANSLPGVDFPHIPKIPALATGGIVQVGERGTEIVQLPSGSAVFPHGSIPASMVGASAGRPAKVTFAGNLDSAFASAFMRLIREGKIQIQT